MKTKLSKIEKLLRILATLFALAIGLQAHAFINVETIRKQGGDGFFGNSSVKVAGQSGNTEKLTAGAATLNIDRGPRDEILFVASDNYGSSFGIKDTNNGQAHLRYTFLDRQPLAYEIFAQTEYDQFQDLTSRNLAGADLRQRLVSGQETSLYLGYGGFYEFEDYTGATHRQGLRGDFYVAVSEKIDDRLIGSATFYYQPLLRDFSDNRIRFQTDLEISLTKRLALSLEYTIGYDSWVPLPTVQTTDTSYTTAITLKY